MDFFQKNKTKLTIAFLIVLSFSFIKCANEANRFGLLPGVELGNGAPLGSENGPQVTTITDIIDNSAASDSHIAKEIFVKRTMDRVINEGIEALRLPIDELPWDVAYNAFLEIGTIQPPADDPDRFAPFTDETGTFVHVYSNNAVNGIRYANVGFRISTNEQGRRSIGEKHLSFEVERFDGNFETAVNFLKEVFLEENAQPCFDTLQDQVFFRRDDWIIEVLRETEDSIDVNSPYPPRTMEDVGVVRVSISSGGHYHHLEGTCLPEGHDHDHALPGAHGDDPR